MKYPKFNKKRQKAIRALYEFCLEHEITIIGTVDFYDNCDDDEFEIDVGVAGAEVVCLPKGKIPEPKHPAHNFLIEKNNGKWEKGKLVPVVSCGHHYCYDE